MKYVRLERRGTPVWGVLEGGEVRTLSRPPFGAICYDGERVGLSDPDCRLLAPCGGGTIVCVGKNYYDHAVELGGAVPSHPILFLKGANTVNDPGGAIRAPEFVTRLDYDGELALVISRRAKNVKEEDFADYILGYTCLNDVTARDIQQLDGQWTRAKSMDGFAPIGPLVTDEVDPSGLHLETRLNGRVVQRSNTALMMTKVPALLAFITASMTLEPGDVVTTGTPAGIGPMRPGDVVEVEIEGIGVLRSRVE